MPLDRKTSPLLEAAWQEALQRLPDRHEMNEYQLARSRELFELGWIARITALKTTQEDKHHG